MPTTTQTNHPTVEETKKLVKVKRHGASNSGKSKDFVKWLLATFDSENCFKHVLDVAGGKGELSARLAVCHGASVTMIEPRLTDLQEVYLSRVVPRLPEKWQKRLAVRRAETPGFLEKIIASRFRQLCLYFTEETAQHDAQILEALDQCTLMIGLHADSATEAILDTALQRNIPFVIVPCCVFPNFFRQRTIVDENGNVQLVRNHEQFCQYLLEKDPRLRVSQLPFDGRNTAIWWTGEGTNATGSN